MLSTASTIEGSMSGKVVETVAALGDSGVSYETNPTGTVIEAGDIDELLAVIDTAHKVVDGNRVNTFLKIDDKCMKEQMAADKIDAAKAHLGREARGDRE